MPAALLFDGKRAFLAPAMTRTRLPILLLLAAASPAAAQPAAPAAQAPRIIPPCNKGGEDILVCGARDAPQPYRLPPQPDAGFDPWGAVDSVSRERHKLLGTGPAGNGSCTVVGPGGWTGCDIAVIKQAEQQGKRVGIGSGRASIGLQVGRKAYGVAVP
jgi:hypothetical protein